MKRLITILLAALCALLPAFAALAESTTLKTEVPSTHTITIVCGEHGGVVIGGKKYSGAFTVEAPRLGTLAVTAYPDSGYGVAQIEAEDLTDVTIKGPRVTLANIYDENTLTISFYELPDDDSDGGQSSGTGTLEPEVDVEDPVLYEPMPEIGNPILKEPPLADVTVIPWRTPIGNNLYDSFIGTGNGLWQTSIVFDGDYQPEDYELLDVFIDDEAQGNSALVCAFPDEAGKVARRSLILSADQMVRLVQEQETEYIIFENGSAIVEMDMADLLGGDMQKLMALLLSGEEEVSEETLARDWSLVEAMVIPAAELAAIDVEVRIVPIEREDGSVGYTVSVWLRRGDRELSVSSMIPSLTVCIAVDHLVTEENFDTFTALYTLAYQAVNEAQTEAAPEAQALASALLMMPDELPDHQADEAERFVVTIPEDGGYPVAAYDANAHLVPYRHYVLAAEYAGEGVYWVEDVK